MLRYLGFSVALSFAAAIALEAFYPQVLYSDPLIRAGSMLGVASVFWVVGAVGAVVWGLIGGAFRARRFDVVFNNWCFFAGAMALLALWSRTGT